MKGNKRGPERTLGYTDADIEHAAVYGNSREVFTRRLSRGVEKGEAMTKPNTHKSGISKKDVWVVKGDIIPPELVRIARENNIPFNNVQGRILGGMPLEKAVREPLAIRDLTKEEKRIIAGNGISLNTYHSRRNKGWTKQKAMTEPVDTKRRNKNAINHRKPEDFMVSSTKETKKFKFKAEVPYGNKKKKMVIGYYRTMEEAAMAEKNALEELNRD